LCDLAQGITQKAFCNHVSQPETLRAADSFDSNLNVCYEVLLYLSSRLMRLSPGVPFTFVTADSSAVETIPRWCDERGYTLLCVDRQPAGRWKFELCR
jgi:TusA-related sulfurtransferase